MKLSELINNTLIAAGVAVDDPNLKALLANPELSKDDIPSEWATAANNIMTIETAKYNPAIKSHFYGAALSPVEKELANLMDAYGFTDEDKTEIANVKSTFAKIPVLKAKLDAVIEARQGAGGADIKKYTDQIQQLNKEILAAKSEAQKQIESAQATMTQEKLNLYLDNILNSYTYTDAIPKDVAKVSARTLAEQTLATKKAKIVIENGGLKLVNSEDEQLPYMENNQPVEFRSFLDKIIGDNRLLKTDAGQGSQGNAGASGGGQGGGNAHGVVTDFLDQQLEALRRNKGTVV